MTNKPVQPGSARWKQLVKEGVIRDGNRNWYLGEAALEIAPMGDDGAHNGSMAALAQYADEIGVEASSLLKYRQVAASWPPETRVSGVSHKVHAMLMGRQELIKPKMTVTKAAEALGQRNVGRTGPRASVQEQATAARAYLADPAVAEEVFADPATETVTRRALDKRDQQRRPFVEQARATLGGQDNERRDRHSLRYIAADGALGRMRRIGTDALNNDVRGVTFTAEEREFLTAEVARVRSLLALWDLELTGSADVDWDAELAKINEEG